jgi:hypothetical protein
VSTPSTAWGRAAPIAPLGHKQQARLGTSASLADWPRTTRLLPWGIAGFMAMIFLFPFANTELPISLPLDAKLDRPVLFVLFALWIVSLSSVTGARRLGLSRVHRAWAVFALIAITSIAANFDTLDRLGQASLGVKKMALLFSYALLFVIAASAIRPTEVPKLTAFMVFLASVTAIGVIVEYRTGYNAFYDIGEKLVPGVSPPADLGGYDSIGRKTVVGPGFHPLAAAMMLSLVLPFAVVGVLRSERRRTKLLYGMAACLMLGGAVATQRKTAFVVPMLSLVVLAAYRPKMALKSLPLGLVLGVLIAGIAPGALGGVVDQLKPSALTGVLTTKDRVSDYDAIRPEVINHPFLGRGYETYDQKRYRILDNQYLTLVVNVGFLGVLGYLGIMGAALTLAHRCSRSRDPDRAWWGVAAAASVIGITLGSALLDTLALPQLPYLFDFIAAFAVVSAHGIPSRRKEWRETFLEQARNPPEAQHAH